MVQYNVSGRYTFTKKLLLLRVEETEFSLSPAPRVKNLTPPAQTPFYMLSLSVLTLPFCDQAFPTVEVAVPLGAMKGCQEMTTEWQKLLPALLSAQWEDN